MEVEGVSCVMALTRYRLNRMFSAATGKPQEAAAYTIVAEIGSLSLEFTRLSQLSGDPKYFDAVQRISEQFLRYQNQTRLAGMWPVIVTPENADFVSDNTFSLGAMSDSLYEYLPKVVTSISAGEL